MKRFAAIIFAILFLLLCGCEKSAADYFSDISNFFSENVENAYDKIAEKAEKIGDGILSTVEKSVIDRKDVIEITPQALKDAGGQLSAYKKLSASEQKLYSIMLTAVKKMELKFIDVTKYVSDNGFGEAVVAHRAVLCDNPDIFWMPKKFSFLSVEGKKDKYLCFKDYCSEEDGIGFYGITKTQKAQMQAELDSAVQEILSRAVSYTDVFEKELFFHDYICENTEYDSDAAADLTGVNPDSMTVYGALVCGKAICEGYSKAMQVLCKKAGIPCGVVYGETDDVAHMWNIIELDGELYYLDVTFDDSLSEFTMHVYFNLTKEQISKSRVFYDEFEQSKIYDGAVDFNFFTDDCKSVTLNYFEKKGAYITEDCALAIDAILSADSEGKNSMELKNITSLSLNRAFNRLKRRVGSAVNLKYYYRYDSENLLVAVW